MKEFVLTGNSIEIADKITLAAENIGAELLVSSEIYEELKYKFYTDKTMKLKLKDGREILIYQMKN